jgi:hypothetical protein
MMRVPCVAICVALLSFYGLSLPAGAQPTFESAGVRALGMGGAFVAVADDATATHWNPAGLATGGPAGMTVGWLRAHSGRSDDVAREGVWKSKGTLTSLGTWPLGVSYGTFSVTRLDDVTDDEATVTSLRTSQFGVTILQTVVDGVVVGSTLRYLRGDVASVVSTDRTVGDALSATDDVDGRRSGAFDLDVSVMVDMRRVRVGATWKNLRSPTFGDDEENQITVPRQTRIGVAVLPVDGVTLALDLDLETVDLLGDPRRTAAVGGEARLASRFVARSGLRWSVEGARRVVASAGLSIGLRPGLWLDGHYTQNHRNEDREFGVALRAGQ